jgi:hypothetical protein
MNDDEIWTNVTKYYENEQLFKVGFNSLTKSVMKKPKNCQKLTKKKKIFFNK